MSLSIFDVDEINSKTIDENEVKLFSKYCGYGASVCLAVEVGECSKELCDNDAVIDFKLKNIFKCFKGTDCVINEDKDNNELELIFRGYESCGAFLHALEFAVQVLREARDRVMFQKEERAF